MIPCPIPDGKQIPFRAAILLDSKKGNRYTTPARRDGVTDYVNEKRAAEEILCAYMDKHGIEL